MNDPAHRRLLDLLAGWDHYVTKCAESDTGHHGVTAAQYEAEGEAIGELYQQAGRLENMTPSEVTAFLGTHVLSLLMMGPDTQSESKSDE